MTGKKRVVITGMGIVSSIGNNLEEVRVSQISVARQHVSVPPPQQVGFSV